MSLIILSKLAKEKDYILDVLTVMRQTGSQNMLIIVRVFDRTENEKR